MSESFFDEYPRTLKEDEPLYIGNWKILHVIGAGGMGKVFEGIDKNDTKAAIKIVQAEIFNQNFLERFEKEIAAMRMLNSPYVAKIIDYDLSHDPPYMAIELIHGKTLAKIIKNKTKITEQRWTTVARQLLLGLEVIKARKLVHRDIKPANIMHLNDRPEIRIIDFGVVKGEDRSSRINQTVLAGTMAYMSPEQLNFETPTHKSDIFSAGITLVELATGKHPFIISSSKEVVEKNIKNADPDLSGLNNFQKSLCEVLLNKNPNSRPSAEQALDNFKLRLPSVFKNLRKIKPVPKISTQKESDKKQKSSTEFDPVLDGLMGEHKSDKENLEKNKIQSENIFKKKITRPHYLKERQKLANILKIFLQKHSDKVFHIEFYSKAFNSKIYFQGYTDKNSNILVEAMSDQFLSIKFNDSDLKQFDRLGFNKPTTENPNYFISIPKNDTNLSRVSHMISDALFLIYEGSHFSEIFLNQITTETRQEILKKTEVNISDDGSFKIGAIKKPVSSADQYLKWQVIGFFGREISQGYVLKKILARHIENNRVHERLNNASWQFKEVDSNPFSSQLAKSEMLKGFVFNKQLITLFDKANKEDIYLDFKSVQQLIDFVPNLSGKYLEEEKANPLTNEMIKIANLSSREHDFSDYLSFEFEDGLSLFTLTSSDIANDSVVGLFAKHPVTNKFYGRKNGEWKLLFESPLKYGLAISFVTKQFIEFFDKRVKVLNKPITWEEIEKLGYIFE